MRLVNSSFEILDSGVLSGREICEIGGRVAYASGDKIRGGSCWEFVERMKSLGHLSVLEHYPIYLVVSDDSYDSGGDWGILDSSPYVRVRRSGGYSYYSLNYRVIVENGLGGVMVYESGYCEGLHERRVSVRLRCDIGVSREWNRHRSLSVTERSTRYCDLSKDKFGGEIGIVRPSEVDGDRLSGIFDEDGELFVGSKSLLRAYCHTIDNMWHCNDDSFKDLDYWLFANLACEWSYMGLLKSGWSAQEARRVLPLDLESEVVYSAFVDDWWEFFRKRDIPRAHQDIRAIVGGLKEEFIKRGYTSKKNLVN